MELMQLEIFLAIAEERNLRKASERVFRTQPALSIALKKLETEIGVPLLERPKRNGWSLTQAGRLLYDYASRMIRLRNEVVSLLNGKQEYCPGRLRIGTFPAENLGSISKLTVRFSKKHPHANLEMVCDSESNLLGGIRDGKIDLAFLTAAPEDSKAGTDLVMSPISGTGRGPCLWIVQRRVGQSFLAKTFGQMLTIGDGSAAEARTGTSA